uniref:cyclic AMP-dependent transcription factor ATF-3-like n=1 Tax=Myxine glutinosa TaxID=7769 RepID=UPI00358DF0C2
MEQREPIVSTPVSPGNIRRFDKTPLSTEEEDRLRRRRERNKIAAEKCRNKKKQRTESLLQESEMLEAENTQLKSQIERLRSEMQNLLFALNVHRPACIVLAHGFEEAEESRFF